MDLGDSVEPSGAGAEAGRGDGGPWIVTKADFSRLMGFSKAYVSKLVGEGKLGTGLRGDGRVNVDLACHALGRVVPRRPDVPMELPDVMGDAGPVAPAWPAPPGADVDPLSASRARIAELNVERQELDLAERRGQLVDRASVEQEIEAKARRFRDRVMAVPAEVADRCAGIVSAAQIELMIAAGLEAAMNDLVKE